MNFFSTLFSHLTVTDLIDITIVSFIIYRFLLIVQGTRAVQMLVGLFTLGAMYWISLSYELYSLHWLLSHFFNYFFVILIILFQEQIRSALVSFGEAKFFGRKKKGIHDEEIEEVISASFALSREKTGALIVFEKNHGLLNYIATGTRLDSRVHSDIIYSLFQTISPLHDGALIIYQGRIQAAGCFLPLSKNVEIDHHLGTRHRAALGITEVSDAIVVIVSEETGRVNISYEGAFYPVANETEMRDTIRKFFKMSQLQNKTDALIKAKV